jgi:hypothetical protein
MPTSDPRPAECVFCAIVSGAAPATFLHEDDLVVALMDIRPVHPGRQAREIRPDGPSTNLSGAGGD